jgi:hypothetical protein
MRFVLHAGMTKTGSTTLQVFLTENAALLARHGVAYPCGERWPVAWQHSWLGKALREESPDAAALIDACRGHEVGVISGETLINLKPRRLERLRELMASAGGEQVRVIVYVRNIADRLLSRLAQKAKTGTGYRESLNAWAAQDGSDVRLENLERAFGADALDVRLMDAADDLVDDFIAAAGLPRLDYVRPDRKNVSADPLTSQLVNLLQVEYGLTDEALYRFPLAVRLPNLENRYLTELQPLVEAAELDHPGLAPFREQMRRINWRDEAARPQLAEFLDGLIAGLKTLKAEAEG